MSNPYRGLPPEKFWRTGVVGQTSSAPENLFKPKWPVSTHDVIATAGSCFAQHVGRHLKSKAFNVVDVEPAPPGLAPEHHAKFGYSMYSARYGNIYTSRQLLQLVMEAFGEFTPADHVWRRGDRYFDAMRPGVEPEGLDTAEEVIWLRQAHVERVRAMLLAMDVFVFTLGLTECWFHRATGTAYPTVPGSVAGEFDAAIHEFRNLTVSDVQEDLIAFRAFIARVRDGRPCRILLTVSPVPLAATASDYHVMQATVHSKAVLRAAAGELQAKFEDIDYFPSFEIITNPWTADDFYEPNRRDVSANGVSLAMKTFSDVHAPGSEPAAPAAPAPSFREQNSGANDPTLVQCEEALLEAFGDKHR